MCVTVYVALQYNFVNKRKGKIGLFWVLVYGTLYKNTILY